MSAWGASCQGENTGGRWMTAERTHHINYLELKAAFLTLQSFCSNRSLISVLLHQDNTTAIAFINRMGESLLPFIRPDNTDFELIHQQRDYNPCRAPPRGGEHPSRLGESSPGGLQWLETRPECLHLSGRETRSLFNRPICFTDKCTAPIVQQLEGSPNAQI